MALELDQPATPFVPPVDRRPHMPEPLPVKLVAVADVVLPARTGLETQLDRLYVKLLGLERDPAEEMPTYRAENFRLRFVIEESPVSHETMRAQQIIILSLADAEMKLAEAEIEYTRQRGLAPGQASLVLLDPAGNWVELVEAKELF